MDHRHCRKRMAKQVGCSNRFRANVPGSAPVSRAGCGVSPQQSSPAPWKYLTISGKFAVARRHRPHARRVRYPRRFRVSLKYSSSISNPMKFFTPQRWAATAEFPIPRNGSSIVSTRVTPWSLMHHSASCTGNVAGCGRSFTRF